jgi:hypothetical protein
MANDCWQKNIRQFQALLGTIWKDNYAISIDFDYRRVFIIILVLANIVADVKVRFIIMRIFDE